jgi:predicted nucleic acid-binding protein
MSRVIILDTGPLGLLTNPKKTSETRAITRWALDMMTAGHRLMVPAIADYEVRRALERAGRSQGLAQLDAFNAARADRYLVLSDTALRLAAKLWAQARNAGIPMADPKELDCDVLIAVQALTLDVSTADLVIATTNVGHLARFVPAALWANITPQRYRDAVDLIGRYSRPAHLARGIAGTQAAHP